jgi:L-ribulose-5-phosphate 4-epimerase
MSKYISLKESCCEANRKLPELGIVDLTFGNVSVYDPEAAVFAIKPSGVDYSILKAVDIVVLDLEGKVVEGSLRPSSDTPTHRYLYRNFKSIQCVVHTHSRNATAFAQAGRAIPCLGTTHSDYFYGDVPVTRAMTPEEVAGEYEWETGKVIVESFQNIDPLAVSAVLVRWHAPFVWGYSWQKAIENAYALEIIAEMTQKSLSLNQKATSVPQYLLDKHYLRKHGSSAYYGQS